MKLELTNSEQNVLAYVLAYSGDTTPEADEPELYQAIRALEERVNALSRN